MAIDCMLVRMLASTEIAKAVVEEGEEEELTGGGGGGGCATSQLVRWKSVSFNEVQV